MAKQKGIIKIEGTMGDITFFKTKDGYLAREHAPISATQINTHPAFQRTRENMAEFGRAGKASSLLRTAIRTVLQNGKDGRVTSRLTAAFSKVIKADMVNARGQRNVIDGEAELLEGFNFNNNAPLNTTMYTPYTATINRVTGELLLNIPPFIPADAIVAPVGATHFKMVGMGASIDFENEVHESTMQETAMIPWDTVPAASINLACNVSANSTHPLFLVMGIQFFQFVNGVYYTLKDSGFNALQVVKVSGL